MRQNSTSDKQGQGMVGGVCVFQPCIQEFLCSFFNVSSTDNLNSLPLAEQRAFLEVPRSEVFLEVSFRNGRKSEFRPDWRHADRWKTRNSGQT